LAKQRTKIEESTFVKELSGGREQNLETGNPAMAWRGPALSSTSGDSEKGVM
jgi:hypothetical protein